MSQHTGPSKLYKWFLVAACFAITMSLGETFWAFGVFFKPLEQEFGWSRALVSSAYTAFLVGYAISVVAAGRLADRYNPRPIVLASGLLAGLGIALCSRVQGVGELRAFLLLAGLGAGATWSVPASVVQRWFYGEKRAGLALAIVSCGVGVGALVFAPLINYLILSHGWRNAYLTVGILFFAIIAAASVALRPGPGRVPAGVEASSAAPGGGNSKGRPAAGVVTTASFVGIAFTLCVGSVTFSVVSVHLIPRAGDVGVSSTAAAAALGLMGGFSIPGRIVSGFVSNRLGWQKVLAFSNFGMAMSIALLLVLRDLWMLYLFVFLFGMCMGVRSPATVGILGQFFGLRSLGELIGITSAASQFMSALGPYLAGFIFDATGSYSIAFAIVMLLLLAAGTTAATLRRPPADVAEL